MNYKKLIMPAIIAFMMMGVSSCKKENISPAGNDIAVDYSDDLGGPPDFGDDGPTGTSGETGLSNFEWTIGMGGNPATHLVYAFGSNYSLYDALSYSFTWQPLVQWQAGTSIPDFTVEVFEVDCNSGSIIGSAITTATISYIPNGNNNLYYGNIPLSPPLPTNKCYILKITSPFGEVFYHTLY